MGLEAVRVWGLYTVGWGIRDGKGALRGKTNDFRSDL